ncbi:MAG: NAD-dependent protein deacylase [Eubacteriales bacterium]|nr:NAD-dependent protein deacylase [Eubacteriales bacterium]
MKTLQQIIDRGKRIAFFGGAGVSTESGIPDFRSEDGLYHQKYRFPPETILSDRFFTLQTEEFFRFYRDKMLFPQAEPNKAHLWLAELEKKGRLSGVVTQNIDGLHHKAGSREVFELHGSVWRNYCMLCGKFHSLEFMQNSTGIPRCECGGCVKPDVVLYGEALDRPTMNGAIRSIAKADVLIIAGTSLTVYPAAGFVHEFNGDEIVLINRDETPMDHLASLVIHAKVGETLAGVHI